MMLYRDFGIKRKIFLIYFLEKIVKIKKLRKFLEN